MKLQSFDSVKVHLNENYARVHCDKCNAKIRWVAYIGKEKVCRNCYSSFKKMVEHSSKGK